MPLVATPPLLGRYRLVERIGAGGMARVYKAVLDGPQGVSSPFVVKRILPRLAREPGFVQMLLTEARLTSMLRHPAIAQLRELGEIDGEYFLVLEYIDGHDLSTVLGAATRRAMPVPVPVAVYVISELLGALAYAHRLADDTGRPLEIVHRDISPSNVMVTKQGGVKLLDFGIAKAAAHVRDERTRTGTLKGKISYLSPELVEGLPIDHRSDIFALGIVLHEMLTLERLFRGADDFITMRRVREAQVEPPSRQRAEVGEALDAVVLRMLARDPGDRFQTCEEVLTALRSILHSLGGDASGLCAFLNELGPIERTGSQVVDDAEDDHGLALDSRGRRPRTQLFTRPPRARRWAGGAIAAALAAAAAWTFAGGAPPRGAGQEAPPPGSVSVAAPPAPPASVSAAPATLERGQATQDLPAEVAAPGPRAAAPQEERRAPAPKHETRGSRRHGSSRRTDDQPSAASPSTTPSGRPNTPKTEIKDPFER